MSSIASEEQASRSAFSRRGLLVGAGVAALTLSERRRAAAARSDEIDKILSEMSLVERVGQVFFLEARGIEMTDGYRRELERWRPGGVLYVQPNIGTLTQVRRFSRDIHATNELIAPLISTDQEGGPVTRLKGDPAPGAVELGKMRRAEVQELVTERSRYLAKHGIDINFAPVADIAYDASSTMATRSFGSDPKAVAHKVIATVKGADAGGVIGAAKHFPGHGRTQVDSHALIPEIDLPWETWLKTDAVPFQAAIDAHVDMVMLGHLRYRRIDGRPMSISKVAVRALREDLGFKGLIVTDDLGMGALDEYDPFDVIDLAIDAGNDILLYASPPAPWADMIRHVVRRIEKGQLAESDIEQRVRLILDLKLRHFNR